MTAATFFYLFGIVVIYEGVDFVLSYIMRFYLQWKLQKQNTPLPPDKTEINSAFTNPQKVIEATMRSPVLWLNLLCSLWLFAGLWSQYKSIFLVVAVVRFVAMPFIAFKIKSDAKTLPHFFVSSLLQAGAVSYILYLYFTQ